MKKKGKKILEKIKTGKWWWDSEQATCSLPSLASKALKNSVCAHGSQGEWGRSLIEIAIEIEKSVNSIVCVSERFKKILYKNSERAADSFIWAIPCMYFF